MRSFFGKIANFFKKAGAKVSAFFIAVLGSTAAKALGDAALEALNTTLGTIIQNACLAVMTLQIGGDAKRKEAFARIVTDAKSQGLQYSTSLVNLLIELAVQRIKENVVPIGK